MALKATGRAEGEQVGVLPQRALLRDEAELRAKSQLTVPSAIVRHLGLQSGDRLVLEVLQAEPGVIHVRKLRDDYAGALAGVYGTPEEAAEYLKDEREAWAQ